MLSQLCSRKSWIGAIRSSITFFAITFVVLNIVLLGLFFTSLSTGNILHLRSAPITIATEFSDPFEIKFWLQATENKIKCSIECCVIFFLYHVRKAAGTSIRNILKFNYLRFSYDVLETEGINLDHRFLNQSGIVSLTSLRHPVERALSLYWYEHVLFYAEVQMQIEKASNMHTWVDYWRDDSIFKQNFTARNPGSVYVEIENCYVKMLTNWDGKRAITIADLNRAKEVLRSFDVVIISEWFNNETFVPLLNLHAAALGIREYPQSHMRTDLLNKFRVDYLSTDEVKELLFMRTLCFVCALCALCVCVCVCVCVLCVCVLCVCVLCVCVLFV